MSAVLFGSISTIADTSELQRQAFNDAFKLHGLDWHWDQAAYRDMLGASGGQSRIADYANALGQSVEVSALHETKSRLFQQSLAIAGLRPRAGVVETIKDVKASGWKLGLVTTTSRANIDAVLDALSPQITAADFDVIVYAGMIDRPKPDKAAYVYALQNLGELAEDCVAIEDNLGGVESAAAAGLSCVAFPNENTAPTAQSAMDDAALCIDRVDSTERRQLAQAM